MDGDGIEDPLPGCANAPWGWLNNNGNAGGNSGNCPGANGNGNGGGGGNGGPNTEVFEKDQYFYHPDHLGSSSYVTDLDGEIFQHLEYFPFGETWVEEHSNTQRTPYLFTSKELDEETGLYYFGARYYDPRTSVWQSPDPILADYVLAESHDGVYQPANLALYSYVQHNPIIAIDPGGEYCIALEQTVTCRLPGQDKIPEFSFPRPEGWPTYTGPGANNYHIYGKFVETNGKVDGNFGEAMLSEIVNNPTPSNTDKPATTQGTPNDATPEDGFRGFAGSFANNDVITYLFEDNDGNPFIVNVTKPTHSLAPGYVLKAVIPNADGEVILGAFGEGTGSLQSVETLGFADRAFNNVWYNEFFKSIDAYNEANPDNPVEGRILE